MVDDIQAPPTNSPVMPDDRQFPPRDTPLIFTDGAISCASNNHIVKTLFARLDPSGNATPDNRPEICGQLVCSVEVFGITAVFFARYASTLVKSGQIPASVLEL